MAILESMTDSASSELTWSGLLETLLSGEDLTMQSSAWAMTQLMSGELTDAQAAGFLTALRAKGETADELLGLSTTMLQKAEQITITGPTLDIVGTGGDRLGTVNISTMSSLVATACGATVVKHGNRGASTTAGAADVIEELGVNLTLSTQDVAASAEEVGITFLFAQKFHPSMRFVGPVRQQLGVRTAFNYLGPLSNPARVDAQALGCTSAELVPEMAAVLAARGTRGMVFRGRDGRDKITLSEATDLWEVRDGAVTHHIIEPEDLGLARCQIDDLRGGSAARNAEIVRSTLSGQKGPIRDAVLINAAAGLAAWDTSAQTPLSQRLQAGMERAAQAIDSGAAAGVLQRWVDFGASANHRLKLT